MEAKKLLYCGKAKSVFLTDKPEYLILKFRDDISALDGQKKAQIKGKGFINNSINSFFMKYLESYGIETHFIKTLSRDTSLVKSVEIVPMECVVRNCAAGSIVKRLGLRHGQSFDNPVFEFFLKNDSLHDPLVNESHAITFGWASSEELQLMQDVSRNVNNILKAILAEVGIMLIDFKLEFGRFKNKLCIADEITPDGCRFWDLDSGLSLDKDRFRQGMGQVIESYEEVGNRLKVFGDQRY